MSTPKAMTDTGKATGEARALIGLLEDERVRKIAIEHYDLPALERLVERLKSGGDQ